MNGVTVARLLPGCGSAGPVGCQRSDRAVTSVLVVGETRCWRGSRWFLACRAPRAATDSRGRAQGFGCPTYSDPVGGAGASYPRRGDRTPPIASLGVDRWARAGERARRSTVGLTARPQVDHRFSGHRADLGIRLASKHRSPPRPVANSLVKALIDFWHPTGHQEGSSRTPWSMRTMAGRLPVNCIPHRADPLSPPTRNPRRYLHALTETGLMRG